MKKKTEVQRVDLGFWQLPAPPDPLKDYRKEWERIPNLAMNMTIIPFGYMKDPDDPDWLYPVDKELSLLALAKKHLKRYSYQDVANWLSEQSGRRITREGLRKRVEIDRRRKRLIDIKRFYAKRYEKILRQIEALEKTRLGKAKENGSQQAEE